MPDPTTPIRGLRDSRPIEARRRELQQLGDGDLVRLCVEKEEVAWGVLVQRYRRLVYAIPMRAGFRDDQAEHVFQETFAKLAERAASLQEPHRVRAWIVTTARRLTIDVIRAQASGRALAAGGEEALDTVEDPAILAPDEMVRLETRHLVRQALLRLGERCRRLLTVLFYDDSDPPRSYDSMARELGMPVGSLGPTRARCLAKLATELEDLRRE